MWSWTDPVRDVLQAVCIHIILGVVFWNMPAVSFWTASVLLILRIWIAKSSTMAWQQARLFQFLLAFWRHSDPWAGQLALRNLRLKKSALDKFRLPVDVLEGVWLDLLSGNDIQLEQTRTSWAAHALHPVDKPKQQTSGNYDWGHIPSYCASFHC